MKRILVVAAALLWIPVGVGGQEEAGEITPLASLVQSYLWPTSPLEFLAAQATLQEDSSLVGIGRMRMHDLEEAMRAGRISYPQIPDREEGEPIQLEVEGPDGEIIPVFVVLPDRYTPETEWPLIFAMHGGPGGSEEGAVSGARRMLRVWQESANRAGWIVAAPAMVTALSTGERTEGRLPYEIFQPEIARAVVDELRARFNVDPDRVVSTGISLGSNFSIAFAAAHPDWLSAIVPVSTEGDSRELLLRNLRTVPTYVLEGSLDQNIRAVSGPRALGQILTDLGCDVVYREFGDRAHEGFQGHYPDVIRWLNSRPRRHDPLEVYRIPHTGIIPVSRRVHWIETDARAGLVHARVTTRGRIDIRARWTGEVRVYLNDRLVELDKPVEIWVNGMKTFQGLVPRSIPFALDQARTLADERRIYAGSVRVRVQDSPESRREGKELWEELSPTHEEGILSFWEMYAMRALEERFPSLGLQGEEAALPVGYPGAPEQVVIKVSALEPESPFHAGGVRAGDLLVEVGGEPFFQGLGGLDGLHGWLLRELRGQEKEYSLLVLRDGNLLELSVRLGLGPYQEEEKN